MKEQWASQAGEKQGVLLGLQFVLKKGSPMVVQWLRICLPKWDPNVGSSRTRDRTWSGKIPHATEQLSLYATTTEPARHNY